MLNATRKTAEHREAKRYPFHWPVAIVFDSADNQNTYHGVTHDVSASGCAILTDHNVFSEHTVTVLLSLPTDHPGGHRPVVEVKARMVYTVLSSGHNQFRCGIEFLKFKGPGHAKLNRVIEQRALKIMILHT